MSLTSDVRGLRDKALVGLLLLAGGLEYALRWGRRRVTRPVGS